VSNEKEKKEEKKRETDLLSDLQLVTNQRISGSLP